MYRIPRLPMLSSLGLKRVLRSRLHSGVTGYGSGGLSRLDKVVRVVEQTHPFRGLLGPSEGHSVVAEVVMRRLPPGGLILDVGAGSCSKAALLALAGYRVRACDDLADDWHLQGDNRQQILEFARKVGVDFFVSDGDAPFPYQLGEFDLVMMNDILEHLHDSPLELMCQAISWTKPGGLVLITVPNAANLRKRLAILRGRTNHPPFADYFWYRPPWRDHVREYVMDDLRALVRYMKLEPLELRGMHKMVYRVLPNRQQRRAYQAITWLVQGARDTLLLVARKPIHWTREDVLSGRPSVNSLLLDA